MALILHLAPAGIEPVGRVTRAPHSQCLSSEDCVYLFLPPHNWLCTEVPPLSPFTDPSRFQREVALCDLMHNIMATDRGLAPQPFQVPALSRRVRRACPVYRPYSQGKCLVNLITSLLYHFLCAPHDGQ